MFAEHINMNDSNPVESDLLPVTTDPEVNLSMLNGCVKTCKKFEPTDENEKTERVGVLDYMPSYRHRSEAKRSGETLTAKISLPLHPNSNSCLENAPENAAEATSCSRDIEQEAFSIAEGCSDGFGEPYASFRDAQCSAPLIDDDDDVELLDPAGTEVELQEVVVQSEQPAVKAPSNHATSVLFLDNRGSSTANPEVATFLRRRISPSEFGAGRDVAWSHPDMARTSPTDSPEPVEEQVPVALKNASYSVSLHSGGSKLCLADRVERQGQSSSPYQSPVDESGRSSEVHLGGGTLQPVEMLSMDRHQMEQNSLPRQNVVFLNDYPFWQSTRSLYRDDSAGVGDRSEVEKRQERRDKRKKFHSLPVAFAKDVAGYVGEGKTIDELLDYITRMDGKSKTLKQKASQHHQTESRKPPVAAKSSKQAQASKTRQKMNKNAVSRKISDADSSVDELVTSKPIEGSETTLPGSSPTEILTVSGGSVWKTAPGINSVSSDLVNASEDAKCKQNMSQKMKQHSGDYGSSEDLSEELVGGFTQTCHNVSSKMASLFYPTSLTAPAVKDTFVEARNSSLQLSSLENCLTAQTKAQIDTGTATQDDGFTTQTDDSTHSESCETPSLKVKRSLTSDQTASTEVLAPLGDHHSIPLSRSASSSEYSYQDETVLLSEENGPWEEFQSKKKRSRNHGGQQSVVRNPVLSARRSSSSGGAVTVAPQKKTAPDPVSVMTRHADGAADVARGQRLPFTTGNSPKTACQDTYGGNVRSAIDVDRNDKLSGSTNNSSANSLKSSMNNSHLGNDALVLNCLHGPEFSVHGKDECATYARMASRESNSVSFRSKVGPGIGYTSISKQHNEIVCGKSITEAETSILDDQTKKLNNSNRSAAASLEENKLGTAKKQQMEKKFDNLRCEMSEAFDSKPNGRLSASLSKANEASDGVARPPVVFCGKVETQFSKESCGISFEYSDEPVSVNAESSFPGNDSATGNASDVRVASGCFHQVSKSCEATSSASGVVNCGRPIAPLSGTGHASLTKTPVLVVSPLPKVLQHEETTAYVVDADPERLKEATVSTAHVRPGISTEVKEPALQTSILSALAKPSLIKKPVSLDDGVFMPSPLPAEIQETSNKAPAKVAPKKTLLESNHARRAKPPHAPNKTLTFNVLEAAQYLAVDWERLLSEGSLIFYVPDQQ